MKLRNKWHVVEKKEQEIMQHVLKMQYQSLLPKYINEFSGVFSMCVCSHM